MNVMSAPARQELPPLVEAEQMVLGACLLKGARAFEVRGGADVFMDPAHRDLFGEILRRAKCNELVSPVALASWADAHPGVQQLGGRAYLARLAGAAVSPRDVAAYADLLAEQQNKAAILDAVQRAQAAILSDSAPLSQVAGELEAAVVARELASGPKPVSMMAATTKAIEQALAAQAGEDAGMVPSGIVALDRLIGGFYPGEMTLIGGRPSMGKSAVALSIALNAARAGHGVVIASLEMNPEALALRALAEATSRRKRALPYASIRRGQFTDADHPALRQAAQDVAELPITFLSREYADIGALMAGARQARRIMGEEHMRLLIVDYAQLLRSQARSRYEQITEISLALKQLSGALNIPVIALSQLSRQVESREDKRPMLSDLRESGQLEQDADAVIFCYRDEYYLAREEPDIRDEDAHEAWRDAMQRARHKLELIVPKQRQGEIGTAHVNFAPAQNFIWEGV